MQLDEAQVGQRKKKSAKQSGGDSDPERNVGPENRAKNRRVEIIIDLSGPMQEQEVRLRELIQSESDDAESSLGIESESDSSTPNEISW